MAIHNYEFQSDLMKKWIGQAQDQGRQEGRQEGREEALRSAVVAVLSARSIGVTAELGRALERADVTVLERWVGRAAVVASAEELLDERA